MNQINVDLDKQLFAVPGSLSLDEVVTRINEWPTDEGRIGRAPPAPKQKGPRLG